MAITQLPDLAEAVEFTDTYTRISEDDRRLGRGVGRQDQDTESYATDHGWTVAERHSDNDRSASRYATKDREGYDRLVERLRTGQIHRVVAYDLDRLLRQPKQLEYLIDLVEKNPRIEIHNIEGIVDLRTANGRYYARMLVAKAAKESDDTSRRVKRQKLEAAELGTYSGGGNRPYGYHRRDKSRLDDDGDLKPCPRCGSKDTKGLCPPEADYLRLAADRYIRGDGFRQIARWLNEEGERSSGGGLWREATVRNMLRSARISGQRVHRGEIIGDAAWPAIVDRETWERLQARIKAAEGKPSPSPWKYLLTKVIVCGHCGGRLYGAPDKSIVRYRCLKGPGRPNCGSLAIRAQEVDELVVGMLLYRLRSEVVSDALSGRRKTAAEEDDGAVEQIVVLERRLEEMAVEYAKGELDMRSWSTARRVIEEELQGLRTRIARRADIATISDFVIDGADLAAMWEELSLGHKQAILAAMIDRIVIAPASVRGSKKVELDRVSVVWRV